MKKTLIVLVVGLLAVGCLTPEQKRPGVFRIPPEALRDSVVGEYEFEDEGDTLRVVFLENGMVELYENGEKEDELEWTIVNREIHCDDEDGSIYVLRINKDKNITYIADIEDGKRTDLTKEEQETYKKIK